MGQKISKKVEEEDYYLEKGYLVMTEKFHMKRGFCCGKRCRHCPYEPQFQRNNTVLQEGKK